MANGIVNLDENDKNERKIQYFKYFLDLFWEKCIKYRLLLCDEIDRNQYKPGEKSYPTRHWNGIEKESERERERERCLISSLLETSAPWADSFRLAIAIILLNRRHDPITFLSLVLSTGYFYSVISWLYSNLVTRKPVK